MDERVVRSVRDRPRHCEHPRSASRRSGERFIIAPTCRSTLPPSVTIGDCCVLPPSLDISLRCCLHSALLTSPISRRCSLERASSCFYIVFAIMRNFFSTIVSSLPPLFLFLPPPLSLLEGEAILLYFDWNFYSFHVDVYVTCKRHLSSLHIFAFCRSV